MSTDPVKAHFSWSHKDVLSLARHIGSNLEDEEAIEILRQVESDFDKEVGVNNDTFRKAIQKFVQDKGVFSNSKQQLADFNLVLSKKYKNSAKLPRIKEFAGICQGIMYDETVYEIEVEKLQNWLLSNIDLRDDKVVSEVYKIYEAGRGQSNADLAQALKAHFEEKYVTKPVKETKVSDDDLNMGLGL